MSRPSSVASAIRMEVLPVPGGPVISTLRMPFWPWRVKKPILPKKCRASSSRAG